MGFMIFWIFSTFVVAFVMFVVFQLDHKYLDGDLRELIEEMWVVALILLIIPLINILVCVVGVVIFIVLFTAYMMDKHDISGEKVLKKIFFIKDEK